MSFVIQTIVEGLGEKASMRILIQRIASTFCNLPYVNVLRPMNTNGIGNLLTRLEGFVENAADNIAQTGQKGGILVLLDSDKKCLAETAPILLARVRAVTPHLPTSVIMAHCEYESWFLAATSSISTLENVQPPHNPESIKGAKEWLSKNMRGENYEPTLHQASFTTKFDLQMARAAAPSFDKLCRDLTTMLTELSNSPLPPSDSR